MLEKLCRKYTDLGDEDISILARIAENMPYICKLVAADVFIDCFYDNNQKSLVVAEARLPAGQSVYEHSVVGKLVLPEKEPAVFSALRTRMPVRDILAITQENQSVRQVVIPIMNATDRVIGVLIQEKDISDSISREKKYDMLARIAEEQKERLHRFKDVGTAFMPAVDTNMLAMKEIHHRVKNNLQLVASMLGLQARRTEVPEIRNAFHENVSRILSIASIYDTLSLDAAVTNVPGNGIPLLPILRKVCHNVMSFSTGSECEITVRVEGDDFTIGSDKATYIALVVNELVMNTVEHAFPGRKRGVVTVTVQKGNQLSSVTVKDDGVGFITSNTESGSLGMSIVKSLVYEKLGGTFQIESGASGSRLFFDFKH